MPESRRALLLAVLLPTLLVVSGTPLAAQTTAPAAATAGAPVRVADLIGLPILDTDKVSLGRVRGVARTSDGKVQLLLPLGGVFGLGERLVAIPIETTALTGGAIAVAEVPPDRFQKSPTWYGSGSEQLAAADTVSITKR